MHYLNCEFHASDTADPADPYDFNTRLTALLPFECVGGGCGFTTHRINRDVEFAVDDPDAALPSIRAAAAQLGWDLVRFSVERCHPFEDAAVELIHRLADHDLIIASSNAIHGLDLSKLTDTRDVEYRILANWTDVADALAAEHADA